MHHVVMTQTDYDRLGTLFLLLITIGLVLVLVASGTLAGVLIGRHAGLVWGLAAAYAIGSIGPFAIGFLLALIFAVLDAVVHG